MNILAIGAHPDDIEYGCGGTLLLTQRIFFYGVEAKDYGRGSALAVLLLVIIALISLIQLIYLRKREDIY